MEKTKQMNVVVFGSGSGTNLEALLKRSREQENPPYKIKALVVDRKCRVEEIGERENIPVLFLPFSKFQGTQKPTKSLRTEYDQELLLQLLALAHRHQFHIDLIILAGYMRLVTPTLLRAFHNRIINVHPGDLTALNEKGERCYVGKDAIRLALENGETKTRSTVHIVTEGVDTGPILLQGEWVEYKGGTPITEQTINEHQEKQKKISDWPALCQAVEEMALQTL